MRRMQIQGGKRPDWRKFVLAAPSRKKGAVDVEENEVLRSRRMFGSARSRMRNEPLRSCSGNLADAIGIPLPQRFQSANAATAELIWASHTRKSATSAKMSSARPVLPSIKRSTRSLSQQPPWKIGSEKALRAPNKTPFPLHPAFRHALLAKFWPSVDLAYQHS